MKTFALSLLIFLFLAGETLASERFILKFELPISKSKTEKGMIIVSPKAFTWNHGLERSYLTLECETLKPGKQRKQYGTEEHFTGLKVTHKLIDQDIELTVTYTTGIPRLKEIRALADEECKELKPIISTTHETYRFPAINGLKKSFPFGETMQFHIKLQTMGRTKADS